MRYSLGRDAVFVIIVLASAISLLSKHGYFAAFFFAAAMAFVYFESDIVAFMEGRI